jgi:AcrR family transcriptional regulator
MRSEHALAGAGGIQNARHEMYRQQIITAAEYEFSKTGFTETKMSSIARTAGVSLATVYKTFSGKAEIWDSLHAERMNALLGSVDVVTRDSASALERLLTGVAAAATFLAEHDTYLDLNIRAGSGWASSAEAGRGVQRTVWSSGLDMIATAVESAVGDGEVRDIRPRVAAGVVVSAMQVWLSDWVSSGRDRPATTVIGEMVRHLRWMLVGTGE